jgi:cation diffusion facilitator family transporter
VAAVYIVYQAIARWLTGLELRNIGLGTALIAGSMVINVLLGWMLLRVGKQRRSLIVEANGRHVLVDGITSAAVVVGLLLTLITGWLPIDPMVAIAVGINMLWSGGRLVGRAVAGLMDKTDIALDREIRRILDAEVPGRGLRYHALRHRHTGEAILIELHLVMPGATPLSAAHAAATAVERALLEGLPVPSDVVTHLESIEDHRAVHRGGGHL